MLITKNYSSATEFGFKLNSEKPPKTTGTI